MSEPRTAAEAYDDLVGMLEAAAPSAMDLRDGAQATRSTLMALLFDCQVLAARSRAAAETPCVGPEHLREQLASLRGQASAIVKHPAEPDCVDCRRPADSCTCINSTPESRAQRREERRLASRALFDQAAGEYASYEYASYEDVSRALTTNGLRVLELEAQVRRLQEIIVAVERVTTRKKLVALILDADDSTPGALDWVERAAENIHDEIRTVMASTAFTMPIEQVNAELRAAGGDPEAIGKRGKEWAERLLRERAVRLAKQNAAPDPQRKAGTGLCGCGNPLGPRDPLCMWCADEARKYRR